MSGPQLRPSADLPYFHTAVSIAGGSYPRGGSSVPGVPHPGVLLPLESIMAKGEDAVVFDYILAGKLAQSCNPFNL